MTDDRKDAPTLLPFSLRSDAQGMELFLDRVAQVDLGDLSPADVLGLMEQRKFAVDERIRKLVGETVACWHEGSGAAKVLLNEGRAPKGGVSGKLIWSPECDPNRHVPDENDTDFSHYTGHVITVKTGQVIATVTPPTPGEPGIDVYGVKIPARDGRAYVPRLRGGCHYDEKAGQVIADVTGPLKSDGETIAVSDALQIDGNVDFNTGHVDAPGDILISGDVADMFHVRSAKNILIEGDVQSADIHADGDVTIGGSLVNHRKGICIAGGNAQFRLVDNSIAVVRGSLKIEKQSSTSDLFVGCDIKAESANINSGIIAARGGMIVNVLGSPAGAHMIVLAGTDWIYHAIADPLIARAAEIEQQLEKRLPAINALRANLKRLTPAQREQATELECDAQLLGDERDENLSRVEALKQAGKDDGRTSVTVLGQIFHGVELRLANRVTKIMKPMRGPVTFTLEQTERGISIVSRSASGVALSLKTGRMEDPLLAVPLPPEPALKAMEQGAKSPAQHAV